MTTQDYTDQADEPIFTFESVMNWVMGFFAALGLIERGVFALAPFVGVLGVAVAVPVEQELIGDDQEGTRSAGGIDDLELCGLLNRNVAAVCDSRWLLG